MKYGRWFSLKENGELSISGGNIDRESTELCPSIEDDCVIILQIIIDLTLEKCDSEEYKNLIKVRNQFPKSINVQIQIIDEVFNFTYIRKN